MNTSLNAARRSRELSELAAGEVVDVLVVGLGVTGAGVALDAASRGLSVAAVDAHDLAFGTSRWSSKLVHGGLRYLAKLGFGVAYESAVERGVLMQRTAPHLVRALPFVFPLTPDISRRRSLTVHAGFVAGDVLRRTARTSRRVLPRPRRMSNAEVLRAAPGLRAAGLRGGLLSWDGQLTDDARLVIAIARTAAGYGARIITRCRVCELAGDGAVAQDTLTGDRLELRARAVINATGVWAGELVDGVSIRPSRGTHLVLRSQSMGRPAAALTLLVPGETSRYVFALPQPDGRVYVGLTDEAFEGALPDVPEPPEADIAFLLDVLNSALETPVERAYVVGAFAGLRPLLEAEGRTADLSRRHAVLTSDDGIVTIVGGKLTTYRRMAQDAVDAVVGSSGLTARGCRTAQLPLVGAGSASELEAIAAPRRLVRRYGTEAPRVAELAQGDDSLLEPLAPQIAITRAELLWGLRHEGALDADDLLDRRTRIGLVPEDRDIALPPVRAVLDRYTPSADDR